MVRVGLQTHRKYTRLNGYHFRDKGAYALHYARLLLFLVLSSPSSRTQASTHSGFAQYRCCHSARPAAIAVRLADRRPSGCHCCPTVRQKARPAAIAVRLADRRPDRLPLLSDWPTEGPPGCHCCPTGRQTGRQKARATRPSAAASRAPAAII